MKRGAKPKTPQEKALAGTVRPCRDAHRIQIVDPNELPVRPDWLTPEGEQAWLDNIGRVAEGHFVSEKDSTEFGHYCNLLGAMTAVWKAGEVPPMSALTESRRRAEQFGLFGAKSRVLEGPKGGEAKVNPFAKLKQG